MLLAQLICERPDELRADLMETYGIVLDEAMEGRYGATFVASLTSQLPSSCRWRVSYDRDSWWDAERMLLASLVNNLRGLIWGMSDRSARGPEPTPVGPSWATGVRQRGGMAMAAGDLMRALSLPRRGAPDG